VETALITLSSWRSVDTPPDTERTVTVGGPGWDPNPDYTTMMIQDWGVLTTYYWFLKNWQYISLRMIKDQKRPADYSVIAVTPSGRPPSLQRHRQHEHRHRRPSRRITGTRRHGSKHKRRNTPDSAVT